MLLFDLQPASHLPRVCGVKLRTSGFCRLSLVGDVNSTENVTSLQYQVTEGNCFEGESKSPNPITKHVSGARKVHDMRDTPRWSYQRFRVEAAETVCRDVAIAVPKPDSVAL